MMKNKATHILTKIAVNIGRLLMAITFIFSGFVKGIDPLGTQYKITDYLEALHIDWMFPSWSTLLMSYHAGYVRVCHRYLPASSPSARKLVSKIALARDERDDADYPVDRHRRPGERIAAASVMPSCSPTWRRSSRTSSSLPFAILLWKKAAGNATD